MFITRNEAVECLYNLINSDVLDCDILDDLEEIANCIDHENEGYHLWGADDEAADLFSIPRSDLITEEVRNERERLCKKYSFTPAPYESGE